MKTLKQKLSKEIRDEKKHGKATKQTGFIVLIVIAICCVFLVMEAKEDLRILFILVTVVIGFILLFKTPWGKIPEPSDEEIKALAKEWLEEEYEDQDELNEIINEKD